MTTIPKYLTAAHKKAKKEEKSERRRMYMWVFMNGKQVRVKRPPTIDNMTQDEWIEQNANSIWLHQNEAWDLLHARNSDEEEDGDDLEFL